MHHCMDHGGLRGTVEPAETIDCKNVTGSEMSCHASIKSPRLG